METGKPLWPSEDYSTFNDEVGTGCWARVGSQLLVKFGVEFILAVCKLRKYTKLSPDNYCYCLMYVKCSIGAFV